MTPSRASTPPPLPSPERAPSIDRTLRRLFLTVFLRGRSSRGLKRSSAPRSVGRKLALTLFFYALFGIFATALLGQPVFALSIYLHGMSFIFLTMFVAGSAGEVLFNKEEADILMHRPISAPQLLRAKIGVMVQVSLWLAGAFNLAGFLVGLAASDATWLFPLAHAGSLFIEVLFCSGAVVVGYQLCLRWFGRERLEGWMTSVQVVVSIAFVVGGQLVPRILMRRQGQIGFSSDSWWTFVLPPAWFAGLDDVVAGSGRTSAWILAAIGLVATALVVWLAVGKLARSYELGVQALGETSSGKPGGKRRRNWMTKLVGLPPLRWWLRNPASRASFILVAAYLFRDRDVKLRIYPGIVPMLIIPFVFMLNDRGRANADGSFGLAFAGGYVGLIPLLALGLLRYSQQWQASDLFRIAPLDGPAPVCHGARTAVHCFLTLPLLICFVVIIGWKSGGTENLPLLLPGLISIPIYGLIPCLKGKAVPFSMPPEEGKAAGRGLTYLGAFFVSAALSGVALMAWSMGWFAWLLAVEAVTVIVLMFVLRRMIAASQWPSID